MSDDDIERELFALVDEGLLNLYVDGSGRFYFQTTERGARELGMP
jgi:hypothetical protein